MMALPPGFRHECDMAARKPIAALLMALIAGVIAIRLSQSLSFAALGRQQSDLRAFVAAQPVLAPVAYVVAYAALVTLSLPFGALMSITGGLLFGAVAGTLYGVAGAGAGAVAVFLLARTVAGGWLARRASGLLGRVRPGLQRDGFNTLLALRLLPVVPFWLMNVAPALAGMRLAPYAAATVLGIIPATAVFVSIGAGLGDTLAAGRTPDVTVIFAPRVLLPLLGLALLALAPIGWRIWRAARTSRNRNRHA